MPGGVIFLSAIGKEDSVLTGNPQITFFKNVFMRHTNFSMEIIPQILHLTNIGDTSYETCSILREGDLIHDCILEITGVKVFPHFNLQKKKNEFNIGLPEQYGKKGICSEDYAAGVPNLGTALINWIELKIGEHVIDTHYGHWMETFNQLTIPNCHSGQRTYMDKSSDISTTNVINYQPNLFQTMTQSGGVIAHRFGTTFTNTCGKNIACNDIRIPLQFWFCKNIGAALPLIAVPHHEVEINICFNNLDGICWGDQQSITATEQMRAKLLCNYIFLDIDERIRYAQIPHEYIIEQVQFQREEERKCTYRLNFKHLVKELIWIGTPNRGICSKSDTNLIYNRYSGPSTPGVITNSNLNKMVIKFNNINRFEAQSITYFTKYLVNQYHTGQGSRGIIHTTSSYVSKHSLPLPRIAVYSFAIKPENHQPSGICNFNSIAEAELCFDDNKTSMNGLYIYAISYNILQFVDGQARLLYT
jgi:hypothetical protein